MKIMDMMAIPYAKGLASAVWQKLEEDTSVQNKEFRAGSLYKAFETQNFGFVIFHENAKTPTGSTPEQRFFKI